MPQSVKECQRCEATTKSGNRCKNRTCRGKLCWQHLKKQEGLRVKPSGIQGAGMGLFTTKPFKKNEKIANYTGEQMSRTQINQRYPGNTVGEYVLCDGNRSNSRCVDGRKTNSSVARFANDAKGTTQRNNARFLQRGFGIKAGRNIPANREVLVPYGRTYWT